MQEASDSDDDSFALPKKFRKAEDTGPKKKTKKERKEESSLAQEYMLFQMPALYVRGLGDL